MIGNNIAEAVAKAYDGRIEKFQKIHNKIIWKQLQIRMTKKYLIKNISPEERQKIINNLK